MAEQQIELLRKLNGAFEQMSLPALSNVMHPDYVHVTRPQSVNVPKRNKAQSLEHYEKMFSNWVAVENVSYFLNLWLAFSRPPLNPSCSWSTTPS